MSKSLFTPTFHRDNTVTLWDVYSQRWVRTNAPTKKQLAQLEEVDRERTIRHCRLPTAGYNAKA